MSKEEFMADATAVISRLFVYPVKSCAGVEVQEAILTETGLEFDRAWMVVDAQGGFLTQRDLPRMALIQPQLKHYEMILRAPGMLPLHVQLNEVEEPVKANLWGETVGAYDMGATAAQWFTDFLGVTARLVRFDPDHRRVSSQRWTGEIEALNQFSDGFPILLISQASLDLFNDKLAASGAGRVAMERFRPNVVLGDSSQDLSPHDEDRFDMLVVTTDEGKATLKPVKPCPRCPIPNIDPLTAVASPEVGDMLQSYRQDARVDGAITFGMNVVVVEGFEHTLKTGQPVEAAYRFD
ncbi:MAG: MOSC N-terminal beta barrel domain-containing protein [Pseudomonadota bacterium]